MNLLTNNTLLNNYTNETYHIQIDRQEDPHIFSQKFIYILMYIAPILMGIYFIWIYCIISYCIKMRERQVNNQREISMTRISHETHA